MKTIKACGFCQYYSDSDGFCAVNPSLLGNAKNCAGYEEDAEKLLDHRIWIKEWTKQAVVSYHGSGDEKYIVDFSSRIATFEHRNCGDYDELPLPSEKIFDEYLRYQNVEYFEGGIYLEKPLNHFCVVHISGDPDSPFIYRNEKDARLFIELIQRKIALLC